MIPTPIILDVDTGVDDTVAILYAALTGRRVVQMDTSDYRPMVFIGLASVIAMFAGFVNNPRKPDDFICF